MIVRVYNFLSEEKPKFSQNLVGIVSDVESFKYTRRAYDIGSFEMTIPTHADEAGCIQPDRMLIVGEKLGQTYIASDPTKRIVKGTFLYITDIEKKDDKITVTGYDLKYLFALRVIRLLRHKRHDIFVYLGHRQLQYRKRYRQRQTDIWYVWDNDAG